MVSESILQKNLAFGDLLLVLQTSSMIVLILFKKIIFRKGVFYQVPQAFIAFWRCRDLLLQRHSW